MSAEKQNIAGRIDGPLRVEGSRWPKAWAVWAILAVELLLLLVAEWPGVADFQKFGFYDEGSWLRMDALFAAGKIPTVDFGYSYGLLPLILGRAWFALFGRTPGAFIGFVTACNLGAAWGMAQILEAVCESSDGKRVGIPWRWAGLACLLLPYAIIPNNYSLMHPLEMTLIVLSLAQQARGKYGRALAFAVPAVLTKPTMGYVLGLLLLIFAWRLARDWKVLIAPAIVGILGLLLELCMVGAAPLIHNLLPLTGGKSYVAMNFGFFHAGMDFWWHREGGIAGTLRYYLFRPPLMFLVGTVVVWIAAAFALGRHSRRVATALKHGAGASQAPDGIPGRSRSTKEAHINALLITLALLHAAFIFLFYAWSGSWTYYSYLWVLGLIVVLPRMPEFFGIGGTLRAGRKSAAPAMVVIAALGLWGKCTESFGRWSGMVREPDSAGLWSYPDFWNDAQKAREMVKGHAAFYLVNGDLPLFWPEAQVPAVWFLSPGIQTPAEIAAIKKQMGAAEMIVTCRDYDPLQEAWNWPEFQAQRAAFAPAWQGRDFVVWKRRGADASGAATTAPGG